VAVTRQAAAWFAVLALTLAAPARGEDWIVDAGASAASFRVRLFALLPLGGGFSHFAGRIRVDHARRNARVDATLDADSVVMPNPDHTVWVRSAEFFDAANHPTIRFRSHRFPLARLVDGGEIEGSLTLRGQTHGVVFAIEPARCNVDDDDACAVKVVGAIRRSDFGMNARRGAVSDRVTLRFNIVARRAVPGTPATPRGWEPGR
jgi:polyisoprenoid-binding protein YceI